MKCLVRDSDVTVSMAIHREFVNSPDDDNARLFRNRSVSYSNGWTGSSMKWRLMRAN